MYTLRLISTADGSHSIYVSELNESYHSVNGAVTESRYVFIRHGLRHYISMYNPDSLSILEIGLGTGLNVLLTYLENKKFRKNIHYTAMEPYPLPSGMLNTLNYSDHIEGRSTRDVFSEIHNNTWNEEYRIDDLFHFKKVKLPLQEGFLVPESFNLIYYDAFSPAKQPEMWSYETLDLLQGCLAKNGILVTYAAKGQVKRDLSAMKLWVETLQGPPGKKEMIRASKVPTPQK